MESEGTKVVFALERDDEAWPPVAAESVWATPLGEDRYRLDNVPWFARGFAYGDVVAAEPDHEGVLRVREQLVWSGRYTVRVIPFGDESAEAQLQAVIEEFASLGAECEGALPSFTLIALDIPPTARVAEIKALLIEGETAGRWGYEEGCIDDRWSAL
jgi:Domain of unknown function (DUF4265)